ncbi:MAG: 3-dehydroquinate synthase [Firmicutes bacterium]|nr:3-dehydroquinate synthase [Bacillota bacterium]
MISLPLNLGPSSYEILLGQGLLGDLGKFLQPLVTGRQILVVSNPTVAELYGQPVVDSLAQAGFQVVTVLVPDGEEAKSLTVAGSLYDRLVEAQFARDSVVVALGGGVVGDLAGFIAATYQRGVNFVQVPTTLLAQVDSSVGGKVAINHQRGKNLIGAFYQPRLVVADLNTLNTLPPRELQAGLAEVIKYGVIWDEDFFIFLEDHLPAILNKRPAELLEVVRRSCAIKAQVVERDEREHGLRAILNFGHTVGHAVETVTGYQKYRHGEAVAVGMAAAAYLAEDLGRWSSKETTRLIGLLRRTGLPTAVPELEPAVLRRALEHDKKIASGQIRFVLPHHLGRVEVVGGLPEAALMAALTRVCSVVG